MAISAEGLRVNVTLEALSTGEGFIVKMNTSMNTGTDAEKRQASRKMQELDILGSRINAHEETFTLAKQSVSAGIADFETAVNQFISDWNSGVYDPSQQTPE